MKIWLRRDFDYPTHAAPEDKDAGYGIWDIIEKDPFNISKPNLLAYGTTDAIWRLVIKSIRKGRWETPRAKRAR